MLSRALESIRRLALPQDQQAAPALNQLFHDDDLSSIGCAYLEDYDVIICQNLHDGKPCNQGISLLRLMPHCYGNAAGSHQLLSCKKMCDNRYTSDQRNRTARILHQHPNVVVTEMELRDVRMRSNQSGPIPCLAEPIDGCHCSLCDFATRSDGNRIERSLRDHWKLHVEEEEGKPHCKRGEQVARSKKFSSCRLQSFSRAQTAVTWLVVPPRLTADAGKSKSTMTLTVQGVGAILATVSPDGSSAPLSINRANLLPFFRDSRAVDFVARLAINHAIQLVSNPEKGETKLFRLKMVAIKRFREACDVIKMAPIMLQEALVAPRR